MKHRWQEIYDDLKNRLNNGEFSVGDPFYTIAALCESFQVSKITAKRVFQELKREGWILTGRRKGTTVNRSHVRKNILFIVGSDFAETPDPSATEFFICSRLLEGLRLKQEVYNVKITPIGHKFFLSHLREFVNKDVVCLAAFVSDFRDWFEKNPAALRCLKTDIRPILLHASEELEGFSLTEMDYAKGIRLAVEHLVKKGHKKIALLTGDINYSSFYLRFKGFTDALQQYRMPVDLDRIRVVTSQERQSAWDAVEELLALPDPPTALVCASDVRALQVLEYCEKKGIRVPGDIAVTGFDNRGETGFSRPPLTTVDSKLREQGAKAVELIIRRAAGNVDTGVKITVEPELVVREST